MDSGMICSTCGVCGEEKREGGREGGMEGGRREREGEGETGDRVSTNIRLQLYSILKSDWSGTWLLLPIDATYHGFYCVCGLRRLGTVVGWSQVEGRSHLTARMHASHFVSSSWLSSLVVKQVSLISFVLRLHS